MSNYHEITIRAISITLTSFHYEKNEYYQQDNNCLLLSEFLVFGKRYSELFIK